MIEPELKKLSASANVCFSALHAAPHILLYLLNQSCIYAHMSVLSPDFLAFLRRIETFTKHSKLL